MGVEVGIGRIYVLKIRIHFNFYQFGELCVGVTLFPVSFLFHDALCLMLQVSHFNKQTFMFKKKDKIYVSLIIHYENI